MSMKVHIQNFQSVVDASLEVKGFTVLVGKSNIGKSATLRAIQGALTNLEGDYFVTQGKQAAHVHIACPEIDLHWRKGGGLNDYTINGADLVSVGRGVPPQIAAAGFGEMQVGREAVSVQIADQFHPLFLLDTSGAIAAEAISDVGRLAEVQEALRQAERDRRDAKSTRKVREKDLDEALGQLNAYGAYGADMALVAEMEEHRRGALAAGQAVEELARMDARKGRAEAALVAYAGLDAVEVPAWEGDGLAQEVRDLERYAHAYAGARERFVGVRGVDAVEVPAWEGDGLAQEVREAQGWAQHLARVQDALGALQGVDGVTVPEDVAFEALFADCHQWEALAARLARLTQAIPEHKADIAALDQDLDALARELHDALHGAGICPTCERHVA